jgi:thiol-disulfide isomerase/thioredoxin
MKNLIKLTFLFLLCTGLASAEAWLTSWDQAVAESKKTGRPILMDFTGSDWCVYCQKLKKEVFSTPEFEAWAAKNVILLEVDFPQKTRQPKTLEQQNERLKAKYNKEDMYPTIVVVNAAGVEQARSKYAKGGPTPWIDDLDKQLKKK